MTLFLSILPTSNGRLGLVLSVFPHASPFVLFEFVAQSDQEEQKHMLV